MSKVMRLPAVIEKTGKPRSTIYSMIENNLFPKQIKLSARSVGWLEDEINAWIAEKVNASRHQGDVK
jgi:prophage regulatory protein